MRTLLGIVVPVVVGAGFVVLGVGALEPGAEFAGEPGTAMSTVVSVPEAVQSVEEVSSEDVAPDTATFFLEQDVRSRPKTAQNTKADRHRVQKARRLP